MRTVGITEARAKLESLVDELETGRPIVLTRYGVEKVMLVSPQDYERLRKLNPWWPAAASPMRNS